MILDKLTELELTTNDKIIIALRETIRGLPDQEIETQSVRSFLEWATYMVRVEQNPMYEQDLL